MTRITTTALLVLALGACAESPDVTTSAEATIGNHCGAYTPPGRSWNGVAYKAPYGKITLALDVQPQAPNMVHVYFIDRAGDFTYDHVVAKPSQLGGVITATVALNQDLAIVGTATGPRPGGSGPRPGQEGIYALDLAGGMPDLHAEAAAAADACPL
ncbi:MAG: hypothetical protein JNK64_18585 [Myxococcales bacterium]|nr:hypothetical protein [Myxococcales bacterium]